MLNWVYKLMNCVIALKGTPCCVCCLVRIIDVDIFILAIDSSRVSSRIEWESAIAFQSNIPTKNCVV